MKRILFILLITYCSVITGQNSGYLYTGGTSAVSKGLPTSRFTLFISDSCKLEFYNQNDTLKISYNKNYTDTAAITFLNFLTTNFKADTIKKLNLRIAELERQKEYLTNRFNLAHSSEKECTEIVNKCSDKLKEYSKKGFNMIQSLIFVLENNELEMVLNKYKELNKEQGID